LPFPQSNDDSSHLIADLLGLAVDLVIAEAGVLGGEIKSFLANLRNFLRKSQVRPLPLPIAQPRRHALANGHALRKP
jgi:hypothetical protein